MKHKNVFLNWMSVHTGVKQIRYIYVCERDSVQSNLIIPQRNHAQIKRQVTNRVS